mmetsp:Transcript_22246/g.58060  ORF Transcript_22246/g.58060 Transcript_22246/m.58060 type:complete len:160 (-) Transcript_22246:1092-1571(-)
MRDDGFIVTFTSPPYTQARNSLAERFLATVTNSAKCMLLAANLGMGFFPEAAVYAALIYNVVPHSALGDISPEESLTGRLPSIAALHGFGTPVWVHRTTRDKAAPKGTPGRYLGRDAVSQCHIVFFKTPKTDRRVKVSSHHVTFDDRTPPPVLNGEVLS